jgi:hypothetical protein
MIHLFFTIPPCVLYDPFPASSSKGTGRGNTLVGDQGDWAEWGS